MIRVIYRWHVEPTDFAEFRAIWSQTTNSIHETVEGAKGSYLLQSPDIQTEVITIAKWDSLEAWKSFWGTQNPKQMAAMRRLGKQLSAQPYEEVQNNIR